jgi:hypothetical protein
VPDIYFPLKQHYDDGGILWRDDQGELVILKPFIDMIIGMQRIVLNRVDNTFSMLQGF